MLVVDDLYADEDKIGYGDHVTGVIEMIRAIEAESSFTIGVFGDWGQGKTSFLRQIQKTLIENDSEEIITVWFNPWRFAEESHLIIPFFYTFVSSLDEFEERNKKTSWYTNVKKKISDFRKEIAKIPFALAYGLEFEAKAKVPYFIEAGIKFDPSKVIDKSEKDKKANEESEKEKNIKNVIEHYDSMYYKLFENLQIGAKGLKMKVVVFIDDLDRCLPEKAVQLLEEIKILLDLPRFVFVIGIAREIIEQGIYYRYKELFPVDKRHINKFGRDYLEKIIQFPLTLPPADEELLKKYLDNSLQKLKEVKPYVETIMQSLGHNPRRLKRFINNISYSLKIAELKDKDKKHFRAELHIKMTLIAFSIPELYKEVGLFPQLLIDIQKEINRTDSTEKNQSEQTTATEDEGNQSTPALEIPPEIIERWLDEPFRTTIYAILTIKADAEKKIFDEGFKDSEEVKKYVGMLAPAVEVEAKELKREPLDDKPLKKGPVIPIEEKISLSRLPTTGPKLFGRERELEILDNAWHDPHTHVLTITAWGGVGKTALLNYWLNTMGKENFRGAEKVYGWSFYSQGATEGRQASADEFMQKTLSWFGDTDPTQGTAADKGRRLAALVRASKTLLILDGMEPLQYPPSRDLSMIGQLKDPGLKTLLKELAAFQPGLCVITSRERLTDLSGHEGSGVRAVALEHLSVTAGTELLRYLGTRGRDTEIAEAVKEYGGHALALTLLGQYISSEYNGDIRKRDKIPALTKERSKGAHARRLMEAHSDWLGESPERDILRMLGLFDRPAPEGAIDLLKAEPVIPGLTGQLRELSEEDWLYALKNLREANLIGAENPRRPGELDCHPLVREHFGEKLERENPEGWQEAHRRLYRYYRDLPGKELPDTLEEMEPLFSGISHGCKAGLHEEAMDDVYLKRIKRGSAQYITLKLGAFGADIAALSHFFEVPWSQPAVGLRDNTKGMVLSMAAFDLRAVGRLREAVQPMNAGLETLIKNEDWKQSSIAASNLSELLLTLGQVMDAVAAGRESLTHADRSGDAFMKLYCRTTLADALHLSGRLKEAERLFREAEEMQKKRQPEFPFLYSLQGFRFCDLLLERGNYREVMERAEKTIEIAARNKWLLDIALDHLSLGRAWMMRAQNADESEESDAAKAWERAKGFLDRAVTGLREAGQLQYLAPGLLVRAAYYRLRTNFPNAWADLAEAREIAESGSMGLFMCDYHLEAGRLCREEGKEKEAREHIETAERMSKEMGYHRRDRAIEKVE